MSAANSLHEQARSALRWARLCGEVVGSLRPHADHKLAAQLPSKLQASPPALQQDPGPRSSSLPRKGTPAALLGHQQPLTGGAWAVTACLMHDHDASTPGAGKMGSE